MEIQWTYPYFWDEWRHRYWMVQSLRVNHRFKNLKKKPLGGGGCIQHPSPSVVSFTELGLPTWQYVLASTKLKELPLYKKHSSLSFIHSGGHETENKKDQRKRFSFCLVVSILNFFYDIVYFSLFFVALYFFLLM